MDPASSFFDSAYSKQRDDELLAGQLPAVDLLGALSSSSFGQSQSGTLGRIILRTLIN
jgi:hypothetical protein